MLYPALLVLVETVHRFLVDENFPNYFIRCNNTIDHLSSTTIRELTSEVDQFRRGIFGTLVDIDKEFRFKFSRISLRLGDIL